MKNHSLPLVGMFPTLRLLNLSESCFPISQGEGKELLATAAISFCPEARSREKHQNREQPWRKLSAVSELPARVRVEEEDVLWSRRVLLAGGKLGAELFLHKNLLRKARHRLWRK